MRAAANIVEASTSSMVAGLRRDRAKGLLLQAGKGLFIECMKACVLRTPSPRPLSWMHLPTDLGTITCVGCRGAAGRCDCRYRLRRVPLLLIKRTKSLKFNK